ncbi:MAG: polyphosphate kinase 1 [Bacteroidetes bacterium]|nr:polyphosphate kinase 1 [Bacteroidota bacterium]
MTKTKQKDNQKTIVRDISWLAFNARVLQEANDPSNHVYDRLRFLGIFSNNLDEFFRVRVATLSRMARLVKPGRIHLEANPEKILQQIQHTVLSQQNEFDRIYADVINELKRQRIFIKNEDELNPEQKQFVTKYFEEKVRSQIVPLMLQSIPTMPLLRDKSIYLACMLGNTNNPILHLYALIEVPTHILPRFIILPSKKATHDIILLEDIIRVNLQHLFAPFGFNRFLGYAIKVTRDSELDLDNDISGNIISELEKGLKNRKKGRATRFVYDKEIDHGLLDHLIKRLNLTKKDNLIAGGRIHNFKDFMNFPSLVFSDLLPRPKPFVHPLLQQPVRIMQVLEQRDVMLHFPYHSFDSIIDLLREAAIDPFVQSIKITCYRLAKDSKIVNALINAVRNGKQVTAMLELRARFDEEANLQWKEKLEDEGVKVLLGFPDMKVHAKLCIIKKREYNVTKQYGFISTGNLNENTATYYTDHCLLTTNRYILADINRIFNTLEMPTFKPDALRACKNLIVSPVNMRKFFLDQITKEIRAAKKKKNSSITLKLNSLADAALIEKLYDAAKSGIQIQLIVRGICCAISSSKAFKKQIHAISIVDEYLEHTRLFIFSNGKNSSYYISSSDWMVRNLDHRIEAACPILDPDIQSEMQEVINIQLSENVKARILDNHQHNNYVLPEESDPEVRSQLVIYNFLKNKIYKQ